jgi:hypothetical protein
MLRTSLIAAGMVERQRMERERLAERLKSYRRGNGEANGHHQIAKVMNAKADCAIG